MLYDDFRHRVAESEPPYTIRTSGGRSHDITDRAQVWIPEEKTGLIAVAIPGTGIFVLRAGSIEFVRLGQERTGAR
jgi:hypothetical protein